MVSLHCLSFFSSENQPSTSTKSAMTAATASTKTLSSVPKAAFCRGIQDDPRAHPTQESKPFVGPPEPPCQK
eukprot:1601462-Amphidinium_carterae.1